MRIAVAGGTGTVGRYAVDAIRNAGYDAVTLARSQGVDVRTGEGLTASLTDVDAVIDVTNASSTEYQEASSFFTGAAQTLQRVAGEVGVSHIVTLSIVGIDNTSFGYYRAKLAQEDAATAGEVPHTVMRATQWHEFPAQMIAMSRQGGDTGYVFYVRVQPVAARTVGNVLVELAAGSPQGRAPDLAGPDQHRLVTLAREYLKARNSPIKVQADEQTLADLPEGGLLPGPSARIEGPSFADWLTTPDAASLEL